MGSRGIASYNEPDHQPPARNSLPTRFVRGFRQLLSEALNAVDEDSGKRLGNCIGVYAFYDYDGEPIYVGQTKEDFATRVGRHLRGQRTDTLAYRILDPFEVAEVELWPAEHTRQLPSKEKTTAIDQLEYSAYLTAIEESKYRAILNEKIPPRSRRIELPRSYHFSLIPSELREDREHPDVRIARRAETLGRVAAVAHERGGGLRGTPTGDRDSSHPARRPSCCSARVRRGSVETDRRCYQHPGSCWQSAERINGGTYVRSRQPISDRR
ncbi:GIY-YIG nuclease family protein [Curtobacterium sp. MCPF17_052]|uniref:GIY-YIG nuclease family protein n=1 Tax=Curtobacterium sp. MCPF17_052 TaxID=2175655 RepID=UPI00346426B1